LWILFLGSLLASAVTPTPGVAAPAELKKVRILMVFDTSSDDLASSLAIDERRVKEMLQDTIPPQRYQLTVLRGKQVTRERILNHFKALSTNRQEGLVFFYGGHGAMDRTRGHYFELRAGKGAPLLRSELRKTMEAKGAGLVLLMTDCCSTPKKLKAMFKERAPDDAGRPPTTIHPTIRALMFRARGTVDITAATDSASWSDDSEGGVFTRTLCNHLTRHPKKLGFRTDRLLSWREFFPLLQRQTEKAFKSWATEMKRRGHVVDDTNQKPHAFSLGNPNTADDRLYAVVSFINKSGKPVRYRYRWTNDPTWRNGTIGVNGKVHHSQPLPLLGKVVKLEAKIEGVRSVLHLQPRRWTGSGKPGYADGREYTIRRKKTVPVSTP
jgi:hypothetical protein